MPNPKIHLTAGIILLCFTLVTFFSALALPHMSKHKLSAKIKHDNCLSRENARAWGEVPGVRKIEMTKTFSFLDLHTTLDDLLGGKVDAVQAKKATYDYQYSYKDLLFSPASNSSVQFRKAFKHIYTGENEEDLKKLKLQTLNIGGMKGVELSARLTRAQTFIQSLFRIYTSFQDNIIIFLITNYASLFYIHDQALVYKTIFLYNKTVTEEQAQQLWTDIEYGWSQPETLVPWVSISAGYIGNPKYDPTTNPYYSILKRRFGLIDNQMFFLTGITPSGQVGPSSILYTVISTVHSAISAYNGCASVLACTANELFAKQFFAANITKNPVFAGVDPQDSIAALNKTFAIAPEIAAVIKEKPVNFDPKLATRLFDITTDRSAPADTKNTLFKIENVEFILNNQAKRELIQEHFDLENTEQAKVLVDYVNYIVDKFTYQGKDSLKELKYTADVVSSNLNRLLVEMGSLLTVNVTAIGTYTTMHKQGKKCEDILFDIMATPEQIEKVCGNPEVTLDSAQGQAPWVSAYLGGAGSRVYSYLKEITTLTEDNIKTLLSDDKQLGGIIKSVFDAIATAQKCPQSPCEQSHVSRVQYANSGYTMNLPKEYFDEKTYDSLATIFPQKFKGGFIPEPTVYAKKKLGQDIVVTFEEVEKLFSFGVGSINNKYEALKLFSLNQDKELEKIKKRYGFDEGKLKAFLTYFDDLFVEYHLGGLLIEISAYDLLWGYEDPFLKRINGLNFFEYLQLFDTKISLFGEKSNEKTYRSNIITKINSGYDDGSKLRAINSRDGNLTLSQKKTTFDGNHYNSHFEFPWNGELEYIRGTDGSGFPVLLENGESISIFEGRFLRNVDYKYDSQSNYNGGDYVFNSYKLDMKQFDSSVKYNNQWNGYMNLTSLDSSPLLVSLPYYKGCNDTSYTKITYDGKPAASYQEGVDQGTFVVEALTGVTVSSLKNYQLSVSNAFPYLLTKTINPSAIPIVSIQETYKTPESNFDGDLKSYYETKKASFITMIVSFVLGGVLALATIVCFRKYFVNRKKTGDNSVVNTTNNQNNYSSSKVESDAGGMSDSMYQRV